MYYNIPIAIDGSVSTRKAAAHGSGLGSGPSKTPGANVTAVAVEAQFIVASRCREPQRPRPPPPSYGIDVRQYSGNSVRLILRDIFKIAKVPDMAKAATKLKVEDRGKRAFRAARPAGGAATSSKPCAAGSINSWRISNWTSGDHPSAARHLTSSRCGGVRSPGGLARSRHRRERQGLPGHGRYTEARPERHRGKSRQRQPDDQGRNAGRKGGEAKRLSSPRTLLRRLRAQLSIPKASTPTRSRRAQEGRADGDASEEAGSAKPAKKIAVKSA